ncbi:MAG TPA: chloride channel protein [Longimicrobiaceae bacterium]
MRRTQMPRVGRAVRRVWLPRALHGSERMWDRVVTRVNGLELDENTILLAFAVLIGLIGAGGVVGFYKLIDLAFHAFARWPGTFLQRGDLLLYRPLLTAAGLALAWHIVERTRRGPDGPNIPFVQLAVARRNGDIPTRPALGVTTASAVTLGCGGSAGSEGPVAVLGSTVGSFLGRIFRFDASRVKVMVAAGAAAGISASFNAPLTGAFFALEEILGSLAVGAFPPVVVASVVAAMVSRAAFGNHPAFPIPVEYGYSFGAEVFLFFPLLGIVAGLAAVLYIRTYFGMGELAKRLPIRRALVPWLGGALVGVLVWSSGGVLVGYGHLAVRLEVFGQMAWTALALLALGKILATSITLSMGGTGGVFTPSLYIGAATGGAFGVALANLFPSLDLSPEAYALVGMGVVVAVATNAPITAILIVFEMTNDYAIVLPLMLSVVIGSIVARRLEPDDLYSGWLRRRGERLAHGADHDILARLRVADAYEPNPQVIGESATVDQLLEHLGHGEQTEFPVVDTGVRLVGVITMVDLGRIAKDSRDLAPVLLAADLAVPTEAVHLQDSLLTVIRRMGVRGIPALPVVEQSGERLVGMITRAHVLGLYQRALAGDHSESPTPPAER